MSATNAMKALLLVQYAINRDEHVLMSEVVPKIMEQQSCRRAQAFRLARKAFDVLCIDYDGDMVRAKKDKMRDRRPGERIA